MLFRPLAGDRTREISQDRLVVFSLLHGMKALTGLVANSGILFWANLSFITAIGPVTTAFQHIQAAYLEFLPGWPDTPGHPQPRCHARAMPGDGSFETKTIFVVVMFVVVGTDAAGRQKEGKQGPAEHSKRCCICGWNPPGGTHACAEAALARVSQWKRSIPMNDCDTGDPETAVSSTQPGSRGKPQVPAPRRGGMAAGTEPATSREWVDLCAVGKYDRGNHLAGEMRGRFVEILQFSQNKLWLTLSLILCLWLPDESRHKLVIMK